MLLYNFGRKKFKINILEIESFFNDIKVCVCVVMLYIVYFEEI